MSTTNHHGNTTTNDAGVPPAPPKANQGAVCETKFIVEGYKVDPRELLRPYEARQVLAVIRGRAAARRELRSAINAGLWVEVFHASSRELIAGPFSPESRDYITF